MNKTILALASLLLAPCAFAADYFQCYDIDGTPEWTLDINLKSKKAAFFDNDSWSEVPYVRSELLKTAPPQTQHVFAGPDAYNSPMQVIFNETRLTASVVVNPGSSKQEVYEAQGGCKAVRAGDLNSGI